MNPDIDLQGLSIARGSAPAGPAPPRRVARMLVPAAILAAFAALVGWTVRERFLPRRTVTVASVAAVAGGLREEEAVLFQAAGWVEPEPYPVLVTPLTAGVVRELMVLEGQKVGKGKVVARLVDRDARIALQQAQAEHRMRQAEKAAAEAALKAAQDDWDNPIELTREAAAAAAEQARLAAEIAALEPEAAAADAEIVLRRLDVEKEKRAEELGVQKDLPRRAAEAVLRKAEAAREQVGRRRAVLEAQSAAARANAVAARERLRLRVADKKRLEEAQAGVAQAAARLEQAEAAVEAAALALERTEVLSPVDGVVLARSAVPGMRVGMAGPGESHGTGVVSLYDPARLQVRVDVPLEHVGKVITGGKCEVLVEAVPGRTFAGKVLYSTHQADNVKNTLPVKVRIEKPDELLRPEMIARVRFTAAASPEGAGRPTVRLLAPAAAIDRTEAGSVVWVVDGADMTVRRRAVVLGPGRQGDQVEVISGLTAADKVVIGGREGLMEGERVRIAE